MARVVGAASAAFVVLGLIGSASAQTSLRDVTRAPEGAKTTLLDKFKGTTVEASTYLGSGSLYASGYSDPYTSVALFVRPSYDLGTRYKLALRGRIYVEEELTLPATPNGRRFYPYDPWVWLAADKLHYFERTKIRVGGVFRTVWPLSYESRYEHLVVALGVGPNFNREFEFGQVNDQARKWTLRLTWSVLFAKPFQTSRFRGSGPGDSTGCLAPPGAGAPGVSGGALTGSEGDRCGGPANTNFAFGNTFLAILTRGKWSLLTSLYIFNGFKYGFPEDALTADAAATTGRTDTTWGIVSVTYDLTPHFGLSAGLSSMQPALDSRYRYPRFPFYDFSGGANRNNFSQFFFSVSGSI